MVHVECVKIKRGRSKLTWLEVLKKDVVVYDLMEDMALDRVE